MRATVLAARTYRHGLRCNPPRLKQRRRYLSTYGERNSVCLCRAETDETTHALTIGREKGAAAISRVDRCVRLHELPPRHSIDRD